jgi:hypothetical protein
VGSVGERVDDARLLWDAGRREGAVLVALVAVAARARQDYPRRIGDREAFERFIRARFRPRISVEFRGKLRSLEHIFYNWMRCELVHEGGLPVDLRFKNDAPPGELSLRAGGAPEYVLLISPGWFEQLVDWALS